MRLKPKYASFEFEKLIDNSTIEHYLLKLYVSGSTNRSARAIENIKKICEENLKGRYTLEIIDIIQNPTLAKEAQITTTPTLVKELPLPVRLLIGDMTNKDHVLLGLNLLKGTDQDINKNSV